MKTRKRGIWITAAFIITALLISPFVFAGEKAEKEDLKPKVTVRVDGLTCPFCAYGLEKRLKKLEAVKEYRVDHKKGLVELYPKPDRIIELDDVHSAIKESGFSPREFSVAVEGKLKERNGQAVLIVSDAKSEGSYLLKPEAQIAKLKAAIKGEKAKAFVRGKAQKEAPKGHKSHPYTITVESFQVISGS